MNADFYNQLIALALVAVFGYFLAQKEVLNDEVRTQLSTLIIQFTLPLAILNSFFRPYDPEDAGLIFIIMVVSFAIILIQIILAKLILGRQPLEAYAAAFSNKGYVGIPIIMAIFGPEAVFYVTPTLVVSTLFSRVYGTYMLTKVEDRKEGFVSYMFKSPSLWAFIVGLLIYFVRIPVPVFLKSGVEIIAGLTSPISMMVLGAFVTGRPLSKILSNPRAYLTTVFRNIIFPIIIIFFLGLLPIKNKEVIMVTATIWSCPTAMDTTIQAKVTGRDTYEAAQFVVTSTIFCLITIPLITKLAAQVFNYPMG